MLPLHRGLLLSAVCALAFGCSENMVAQDASSGTRSQSSGPDRASAPAPAAELPDSPGTIWAKSQGAPQESAPQQSPQQSPPPQSANSQSDSRTEDKDSPPDKKQDERLQRPVGTAAAEGPRVSGVTAAQPAGAAIAPAKQRRVRTIVLKVGAIIGAGAAIGTVVALSAATPSKPPGAH